MVNKKLSMGELDSDEEMEIDKLYDVLNRIDAV